MAFNKKNKQTQWIMQEKSRKTKITMKRRNRTKSGEKEKRTKW